ncbi:hypothetical protein U9M48_035268 [Paspalum notatum var. saurae]|uniref:RING-type domain-containing protein n=1 Tax=Paspalum notatum var. saurae TaxID=547442 RepID=A0AAQ3X882_PASNO
MASLLNAFSGPSPSERSTTRPLHFASPRRLHRAAVSPPVMPPSPPVPDDSMDDGDGTFEDPDVDIAYSEEDQDEDGEDQWLEGAGLEEQEGDGDGQGSTDDDDEDEDDEWETEDFAVQDCGGPSARARVSEPEPEVASSPTCPVCMEPWASQGEHRISCIPCGHVYGRSCLKRWLTQCGNQSAKCPQCDKMFEHKDIINLYAPQVAIPNSELQKEISYLREKNTSYLREREDFQKKEFQAQIDQMHAVVAEHLKANRDKLEARMDQMHAVVAEHRKANQDKLEAQFDQIQANLEENMKAQHDYFISYIAEHKAAIQAKFKQLGIPMVPFPPFEPPQLVMLPRTHRLGPQESAPKLTPHTPSRPQGPTS